ncbi:hypothetical protein ACFWJ4_40330 [Kitasatospora sp. NPDC127067]|uniref:hypothetical protein n=1 Tax=Kitasatospora sp. NPDC127067 TaxID=3347126 RepID=UPI003663BC1E
MLGEGQGLDDVAGLGDDPDVGLGVEDVAEAGADHALVVGEQDPDGRFGLRRAAARVCGVWRGSQWRPVGGDRV